MPDQKKTGRYQAGISGNPAGRPPKGARRIDGAGFVRAATLGGIPHMDAARADSWYSATTKLGTTSDKATSAQFYADSVTDSEARSLWRSSPEGAKAVEKIPETMLRAGFKLCVDGEDESEDDTGGKVQAYWEDLELEPALLEAMFYENAFGGAAILLGVEDGGKPADPLNIKTITKFDFLTVFQRAEITAEFWYTNPNAKNFGRPSHYRLTPQVAGSSIDGKGAAQYEGVVHESRLILFRGAMTGRVPVGAQSGGFGDGVFSRIRAALRGSGVGWQSTETLLNDFAQAVWKIKGLTELVAQDRASEIRERMLIAEESRSTVRAVWIDSEDEFERKQTPLTGLPEIHDRLAQRVAAAADMPATVMFGETPQGLNATGKGEERTWYDTIAAKRAKTLTPKIEKVVRVIFAALKIPEPDAWSIEYGALYQDTPKEIAEVRKLQAETDDIYIANGTLHPDEVARARARGADPLESIDFDDRPDPEKTEPPDPIPIVPMPPVVRP